MKLEFELVLPCYNEARSLEALVRRARDTALAYGLNQGQFRLVMVNNGSRDDSADVLSALENSEFRPWIRVVNVTENQGYGHGIFQGLLATEAPVIGWSHADQQCDPSDAFRAHQMLVSKDASPNVLVKGVRRGRSLKERLVSRVFEVLAGLILGAWVYDMNAQPKVFRREMLLKLTHPPKTFAFDLYVLNEARRNSIEIRTLPVDFLPRVHGVSHWAGTLLSRRRTILGMIRYMFEERRRRRAEERTWARS
jgi:glycosyltransferase involved in cell wall biosynthesis